MAPILRFAPSPTGRLHLGNARTALVNWLAARQAQGRFLLRLDDTDRERSTAGFERAILEDLAWLGLDHDGFLRQSERGDLHARAFAGLRERGLVYPAYETAEELAKARAAARAQGRPPRYDRTALTLSQAARAALEAQGRRPYWRLRLSGEAVAWTDRVQGAVSVETAALSDPVLLREDGAATYTLASVVDDLDCGITEVIRGADHRTNTAVQIELFRALGGEPPAFAHLPLLLGEGGAPLSKRDAATGIGEWRALGIEPHAIRLYLASLGTDRMAEPSTGLTELIGGFDLARYGRGSAVFAADQLERLSRAVFQGLPADEVRRRPGCAGLDEAQWAALRGNAGNAVELCCWLRILTEPLEPVIEDRALLETAAGLLPEALDGATAAGWLKAVQQASGRKGKALFHPLRLALTGRDDGPRLADLLPLLGSGRARRRLLGETA